jgi:SAM-dependent methyltransferase
VPIKSPQLSGRDYYQSLYQTGLESEARWLSYGASQKTDSIETLLQRNRIRPQSLLELGCGTGAVILECQRRGLAKEFSAIDYSVEAIDYLKSRSTGISCSVGDITASAFSSGRYFDVVVLSHVLEHLENPREFLKSVVDRLRLRYLICEVPLENLIASRIKNLFRDRMQNSAGHVQFFTETSFKKLVQCDELNILDSYRYVSVFSPKVVEWVGQKDGRSNFGTAMKKAVCWYLPRALGPVWSQLYMANCAILCERRVGKVPQTLEALTL